RLEAPRLRLGIGEDGAFDWLLQPETAIDPHQIRIEKITVERGQIHLRHGVAGREHLVSDLNARLSARTLAGPWRLDGSLSFDGLPMTVSGSTGSYVAGEGLRVRLALQPDDYPIAVESDGTMAFSEGGASYAGQFRMESLAAAETLEEQPFVVHVEDAPPPLTYRIVRAFRLDH